MTNISRPMLIAAGVLVLLLAAALWTRDHRQLLDARRSAEAAQLTLKNQIVSAQESTGALKADVAKLLAENEELRAAYDAARAAAPGAQPVHAETLSTGPVVVAANPRPAPIVATAEDKGSSPAEAVTAPIAPACALAEGDKASIDVQEIALQTKEGNVLVVGTAAAWRESPLPRAQLFGGKFQSSVSDVSGLAPPSLPRWGAGAAAACFFGAGCSAGPAVAIPPLRIFSLQLEATVGVLAGPQGLGAVATGVGRW